MVLTMINIKSGKDYLVALESLAMTDIVLNMFIFFFVSFSLIYTFSQAKISKIDVNLPKASSAVSLKGAEKAATIAITKKGEFYLDDELVKSEGLKSAIQVKMKEEPAPALILKVDGVARFETVAKALDVINELNIKKVSIAAVKSDDEG